MITINEVPTKTPMPTDEINRSWDAESAKTSGNEPTTKDLNIESISTAVSISFLFLGVG